MTLPTIWQLGAGDDSRRYGKWLLDHHVAAIGPGSGGPWPREGYDYQPPVRRFAGEAQPGDLVVLKEGRRRALAIGVLGEYEFVRDMDHEGWDLCHVRRVRWLTTIPRTFAGMPLAIDRFCRLHPYNATVYDWVRGQTDGMDLTPPVEDDLPPLHDQGPLLDPGLLPAAVADVVRRARTWSDLTWNDEFGTVPSEAEVLCHVTVPLLVALGWPRTQIALEWRRRDIALFADTLRTPESCRVVIEGKVIGRGLHSARTQVDRYAREFHHPVDVAVTDGPRMLLYRHENPDDPLYMNCSVLRADALALLNALRAPGSDEIKIQA